MHANRAKHYIHWLTRGRAVLHRSHAAATAHRAGRADRQHAPDLNIGVTNPLVRRAQLGQLMEEFLCPALEAGEPFVLCGDTNACANKPEPEMAW